jgi:hypothetical protein
MEVVFGAIGAIGVMYGIGRDITARRERRRREDAEADLRRERERREARLFEPDIEVRTAGHTPEEGGDGATLVSVIIANKVRTSALASAISIRSFVRARVEQPLAGRSRFSPLGSGATGVRAWSLDSLGNSERSKNGSKPSRCRGLGSPTSSATSTPWRAARTLRCRVAQSRSS